MTFNCTKAVNASSCLPEESCAWEWKLTEQTDTAAHCLDMRCACLTSGPPTRFGGPLTSCKNSMLTALWHLDRSSLDALAAGDEATWQATVRRYELSLIHI